MIVLFWILSVALAGFVGMRYGQSTVQPLPSPVPVQASAEPAVDALPTAGQDELQALIDADRHFAAIELALTRLAEQPHDSTLRFQLARLYEITHQFDAAISELLTIRSLSLEQSELTKARRHIDGIVRGADQRFAARRATAEAIGFFERQTMQEPSYDLHRYFLAKWLLKSGDTEPADRLIRELGLAGITSTERQALKAELERRRSTLPVRREGNAIYADLEVTTPRGQATLTLLVDTGASLTAVAHYKLREMGATRTPHRVRAQTANGTVDVPVYELLSITGGPLTLNHFLVGSLNDLPDQVDGLLGLDFLDQLPVPLVNASSD